MDRLETVKKRFESYGYKATLCDRTSQTLGTDNQIIFTKHYSLVVAIPQERKFRNLIISDDEDFTEIEANQIEKFRFISGYEGIWSKELAVIECELEYERESSFFWEEDFSLLNSLLNNINSSSSSRKAQKRFIEFPAYRQGVKVLLGDSSSQYSLLEQFQRKSRNSRTFTIRIEGLSVNTHDEALSLLIKFSNSVLFQFDLVTHIPIRLKLNNQSSNYSVPNHRTLFDELTFSSPKFEYDKQPLALYMYARNSMEMPLLQYLAFYQVLEFYFPMYSLSGASIKIKNFIKNPLFDVNKDSDIAHIVDLIKVSGKGKAIGDERSQIKTTIQCIVDEQTLLNFFNEYPERKDFFDQQKKNRGIAKHRINFASAENDIRVDTALRIYEIRCRVVHSKDDENFDLLLPYSEELMEMNADIQLVEFLAQKAIIAASRALIL